MKKKKKHIEIEEVSDVKLKPIFGIQPGLYLTVLYAAVLLIVLFALLLLPGIRKYGSDIEFISQPKGVAVFVDGVYLDSTPFTRFVPAGKHTLRFEKPYFETESEEIRVPGKIFGTLLFKRAESHLVKMDMSRSEEYLNWRFGQISNWSLVGSFYDHYPYPFRGVQAVSEFLASEDDVTESMYDFSHMLLNNIASFEQLVDVAAALHALTSPKYRFLSINEYTSVDVSRQLIQSAQELLVNSGASPTLAALYVEAALRENSGLAEELLPEYKVDRDDLRADIEDIPFSEMYAQSELKSVPLQVREHTFIEITPPELVAVGNNEFPLDSAEYDFSQLNEFPHSEPLEPYFISSGEVTRRQFDRFLKEEPEWSAEHIDKLIQQGKVDEQYLSYTDSNFIEAPQSLSVPVTHVSWYAAKAYSRWFESKLPSELKERFSVRLPTETEWEFAARKNSGARAIDRESGFDSPQAANYSREGRLGLVDMQGNVWEWNENWYFTSDVLDGVYGAAVPRFDGSEKAMRGGSWANRAAEVPVWRRASHPPQWCSPFVGFRIVLEPIVLDSREEE
ncbi:MAG: SUMF1/EgtB/PvdO family nonheme iron enzyme [Spirochaetaceae bacterium]|nr:SUMF1/EgtB/PvdO family nonheme iron enzyme [Spirochaetaceae bacterium]MCF7948460.1 SUMF1/EgtB/PvdO family nonheme iron enzyme [Spirochaetia bacterium]MCF7950136.1 SUMF1/EgtB/PvdO family nonheme iron enzyme [Spirochaetaceae bacterium]